MSHDRKHQPRYLGPYEVEERTIKGNYRLKELDGTVLRNKYAAFRILPYITRNHPFMLSPEVDEEEEGKDEEEAEETSSDSSLDSEISELDS